MLLVKLPDREYFLEILRGLQRHDHSRQEVVSWQEAVKSKVGWAIPLSVTDGYWYFYSVAYLTLPSIEPADDGYLIRNDDIDEYILDIEAIKDDVEYAAGIKRLRGHEIDTKAIRWPLTIYPHRASGALSNAGLKTVRGIFEPGQDLVEHSHLQFENTTYLIVRQLDEFANETMILGTDKDYGKLGAFMSALGLPSRPPLRSL